MAHRALGLALVGAGVTAVWSPSAARELLRSTIASIRRGGEERPRLVEALLDGSCDSPAAWVHFWSVRMGQPAPELLR